MSVKQTKEMPRVRFCWLCSRKLRGNSFTEQVVDGHSRILHKACWMDVKRRYRWIDEQTEDWVNFHQTQG